jgi:hypothetical protein
MNTKSLWVTRKSGERSENVEWMRSLWKDPAEGWAVGMVTQQEYSVWWNDGSPQPIEFSEVGYEKQTPLYSLMIPTIFPCELHHTA